MNPDQDHPQYIRDTISCLESIYKYYVVTIAFSYKKQIVKGKSILYKKMNLDNIHVLSRGLTTQYNKVSGCIADPEFISSLITLILDKTV